MLGKAVVVGSVFGLSTVGLYKLMTARVFNRHDQVYEPPVTSIVMCSLNEELFIERALQSLEDQNVLTENPTSFERILIDSHSDDETVAIAENYGWKVYQAPRGKLTARHVGMEKAKGKIIVSVDADSIPSYSPIIIRSNSDRLIEVVTVEELWNRIDAPVTSTIKGEEIKQVTGYSVYSGHNTGSRYIQINQIIRHPYAGLLLRFNCVGGLFDVSPNHSLIGSFGRNERVLEASRLLEGGRLSAPVFNPHVGDKEEFFYGNKEIAWLLGFFAAEGCACMFKKSGRKKCWDVSICNTNKQLIDKAEHIFAEFFNVHRSGFSKSPEGVYSIHFRDKRLYEFMRPRFYTADGKKRVPKEILNAPKKIQCSFLKGYFDGDGESKKETTYRKTSYQRFSTNSWILAQGILILVSSALKKSFSIADRKDKPDIVALVVNHKSNKELSKLNSKPRGLIKSKKEINYSGYLYDLVTSEGAFNCGVGQVRVHNTFYPPNWLNLVLRWFRHPNVVGVVTPRLVDPTENLVVSYVSTWLSLVDVGPLLAGGMRAPGQSVALYKQAYFDVGGFNLNINQRNVHEMVREEEIVFAMKLRRLGRLPVDWQAPCFTSLRRVMGFKKGDKYAKFIKERLNGERF